MAYPQEKFDRLLNNWIGFPAADVSGYFHCLNCLEGDYGHHIGITYVAKTVGQMLLPHWRFRKSLWSVAIFEEQKSCINLLEWIPMTGLSWSDVCVSSF